MSTMTRTLVTIGGAILALVALAGCVTVNPPSPATTKSVSQTPTPTPTSFDQALVAADPWFAGRDMTAAQQNAREVCSRFDGHYTRSQIHTDLMQVMPFHEATTLITVSTAYYCPQFSGVLS